MRRLGITQRVDTQNDFGERRDCLDQRWYELVLALDFIPVPLPCLAPEQVDNLLNSLVLDAVLLSGGNTLSVIDPDAPDMAIERDAFEKELVDQAIKNSLPVVGVCRGMQHLNILMGGGLSKLEGHVGKEHALRVDSTFRELIAENVNSYHNWGIAPGQLADRLQSVAMDNQGYTEAFVHQAIKLSGIMWHPERQQPVNPVDIDLLRYLLK